MKVVASLGGAASMMLSHASVFVAGGIALALVVRALLRRDRGSFEAAAATIPWLVTGVFIVVLTSARTARLDAAIEPNTGAYGHGAGLASKLNWLRDVSSAVLRLMGYQADGPEQYLHWPLLVLMLVGAVGLARRRPTYAAFLLLPFALTWVASGLHRYPVFDRTVLFLVPATVLFVAEGAAVIARAIPSRTLPIIAAGTLAAAVLLGPLAHAAARTVDPRQHEETKRALEYIRRHWKPGDALFVDRGARFALRYYLDCNCLRATEIRGPGRVWRFGESRGEHGRQPIPLREVDPSFVVGRLDARRPAAFAKQLHRLEGRPRVWILYTHVSAPGEELRIGYTLRTLDRTGRRLAFFGTVGAHAYLYDLRPRSR